MTFISFFREIWVEMSITSTENNRNQKLIKMGDGIVMSKKTG